MGGQPKVLNFALILGGTLGLYMGDVIFVVEKICLSFFIGWGMVDVGGGKWEGGGVGNYNGPRTDKNMKIF